MTEMRKLCFRVGTAFFQKFKNKAECQTEGQLFERISKKELNELFVNNSFSSRFQYHERRGLVNSVREGLRCGGHGALIYCLIYLSSDRSYW